MLSLGFTMVGVIIIVAVVLALFAPAASVGGARFCEGEFALCPTTFDCTMSMAMCGKCKAGEYLCPSDQATCVEGAAAYSTCPGLQGTHLDVSLSIEARLDYLVEHTNLTTQIAQMTNTAPAIPELGIPEYQWLNDDQHGVSLSPSRSTVFPNGNGLGATWSTDTLHRVGTILGVEARGIHNGLLSTITPGNGMTGGRTMSCNGCGITLYSPNLNIVRDPRWGRAQETFGEDPTHMAQLVVAMVTGYVRVTGWTGETGCVLPKRHMVRLFGWPDTLSGTSLSDTSLPHHPPIICPLAAPRPIAFQRPKQQRAVTE